MGDRHVVVVDCETTGLDPATDFVVEVAYWDLTTGERGQFVPPHNPVALLRRADSEPQLADALRLNGYRERIGDAPQDVSGEGAWRLSEVLAGNTLAGSNPSFDAAFLRRMFEHAHAYEDAPRLPAEWHHRLLDLAPYAAGVLGLPLGELPGLARVCELLGVTNTGVHTADGDVDATGRCLLRLTDMASARRATPDPERSTQ